MTFMDLAEATPLETMQGYSFLPALLGKPWKNPRPAVMFGLNFLEEYKFENSFYPLSLGQKYFDGASAVFDKGFLKLICCPHGCRKQGRLLPHVFNEPQVALMNVTSERSTAFEQNILKQGSKHGLAEALYLANFLGEEFQKACLPLLHAL